MKFYQGKKSVYIDYLASLAVPSQVTIWLVSLLLSLLSVTVCAAPLSDYRFAAVKPDLLEQVGVQVAITQDHQGFMWFGGNNGLARFDGYDVKIFRNEPDNSHSLSHNNVTALLVDHLGRLWVATSYGLNLFIPETNQFKRFLSLPGVDSAFQQYAINCMAEDAQGNVWIGTQGGGLAKIDGQSGELVPFTVNNVDGFILESAHIWSMHSGSDNRLWIGSGLQGVATLDLNTMVLSKLPRTDESQYSINDNIVYAIYEDSQFNIWIGTSGAGLYRYSQKSRQFFHYTHQEDNRFSINDNAIWSIYEDQARTLWVASDTALHRFNGSKDRFNSYTQLPGSGQFAKIRAMYQNRFGDLWFGLFPVGSAMLDVDAMVFRNFQYAPNDEYSLSYNSVTAIAEDKKGNFWVGTDNGLNYFNSTTGRSERFFHDPHDPNSLPSNAILSVLIDSHDTLWVGTWKGGWASFNEEKRNFVHAKMVDGSSQHMTEEVWTMYEDRQQQLWVAGLYLLDRDLNAFRDYRSLYPNGDELSSIRVKSMYEDSEGIFWIGTAAGLDILDRATGKMRHFYHDEAVKSSLSDHFIKCIFEDNNGQLYFGTRAGGLNLLDKQNFTFSAIRAKDGITDDLIAGMIGDNQGSIWIITGNGLVRYTPERDHFEVFNRQNRLLTSSFLRNTLILTQNGNIVFGGSDGLTILNPDRLKKNPKIPPIVFTEFQVLNKTVIPQDASGILSKSINKTEKIILDHSQSVFSFKFSALNFRHTELNNYSYKLEGFDQHWNDIGHARTATYTNLNPGKYTFRVIASNNSNVWNKEGVSIDIDILPPWWRTYTAFFIYMLFFAFAMYEIIYIISRLKNARNEQLLNSRLRHLDKLKDTFLANTSHELRTPLNGIIGLTEAVLSSSENQLPPGSINKLRIVVSSGKRLANLINDILDFSKLKNHAIKLNYSSLDLYRLVDTTLSISEPLVGNKDLTLLNKVPRGIGPVLADEQRLNQIMLNLIGNAIKFTSEGRIEVSAMEQDGKVFISITDTGSGIEQSEFSRIFEPFEQTKEEKKIFNQGTGLGLAVTKQLIELHRGEINVQSTVGCGSTFTFSIPQSGFDSHPAYPAEPTNNDFTPIEIKHPPIHRLNPNALSSSKKHRILIVDDEPVNRLVLESYLGKDRFDIVEAKDGEEALYLVESKPAFDLVLLDVMMPGLTGYDVCRELRKTHDMTDLPILFLTAKSQLEDLHQGYQLGANDFLFKPVIREEFLCKVHMHLQLLDKINDIKITSSAAI